MSEASAQDTGPADQISLRIECEADHRADADPRRLLIGGREVAVTEIIDRWLDPHYRDFKLRGDDGGVYLVRHVTLADRWALTLYQGEPTDHPRFAST